jgi:hypothetical protein
MSATRYRKRFDSISYGSGISHEARLLADILTHDLFDIRGAGAINVETAG